jgi:alpha-N-arabinofuranosidase
MVARVRILADEPIGTVSPRLYGHFAEHLGRCCYDGLWVGKECAEIPHEDGFRKDVLDALRAMPVPLLRWPGGCYADHYHWRDGIGPERPVRLGMSCGFQVLDDNTLGTHEFLDFCAKIGAEPYLAGNVGSGSPQELCDWIEYTNTSLPTTIAKERQANGRQEPWGVRLWGVGNENWGCGGEYVARDYGREYRRYAGMLRHVDPQAELVVCGHDHCWNVELAETMRGKWHLANHFSIHRYWIEGGPGESFNAEQYYALLREADETEDFVKDTREILNATGGERIGIALDEWGVWHPEARTFGPGCADTCTDGFEQACTQRDALAAAIALEGFHRQCGSLSMANLAQIVNVIHAPVRTDGTAFWLTPTYHLLRMHTPHLGGTALRTEVEVDEATAGLAAVGATATTQDGLTTISFTNRHHDQPVDIEVAISGPIKSARLLAADLPNGQNTAEDPDAILANALHTGWDGPDKLIFTLPPHSMATVVVG